jgi:hypothetical protein
MKRDHYQKKAMECLLIAEGLRDPAERLRLLGIAQQYIMLAAHVTTRIDPGTPLDPQSHKRSLPSEA